MFDGLLGRKFQAKCKTSLKLMKVRMEVIKKKRNSVQKFLRKDIAELLRNSLDINAYGRAEGLLVEVNRTSCYDLIEEFCTCISSHVSVMDKQRECPEECKEAVASLMYAAARFADLPELRELRNIFTHKYGNSMDDFVNNEFVEKLRPKPLTKDMKLQLLQDIAQESSIDWNSKGLEQKLYTPPPPPPQHDHKTNASFNNTFDDGYKWNKNKEDVAGKRVSNREKEEIVSHERPESYYPPTNDIREVKIDQDEPKRSSNAANTNVSEKEEAEDTRPFYHRLIPPPYVRPRTTPTPPADLDGNEVLTDIKADDNYNGNENLRVGDSADDRPKPISVRRRKLKPPPGRENAGSSAANGVIRGENDARMGLKTLSKDDGNDDKKDEEERLMDGLLLQYSRKKPSPYKTDKSDALVSPPARTKSFPPEVASSPTKAATKGPLRTRATSFQPDMMNHPGGGHHVHPKLPDDFDDLAARIAALSGR